MTCRRRGSGSKDRHREAADGRSTGQKPQQECHVDRGIHPRLLLNDSHQSLAQAEDVVADSKSEPAWQEIGAER